MRTSIRRTAAIAATVIAVATLAAPARAEGAYNATVAGQPSPTPLVALVSSSVLTVDVVNLPAGVGLYALHCKVPADPRQPPTVCDASNEALAYLPADAAARASVAIPIRVNAEFYGANPNPTGTVSPRESVDCRADTGNPRSTTCALYVLGAGRDSANPAYLRVWPTVFSSVKADRLSDEAAVILDGTEVLGKALPKLVKDQPVSFSVVLASGQTASVSSDTCSIAKGKITALASSGTCTVLITSTGGKNFKPLVARQSFRLTA